MSQFLPMAQSPKDFLVGRSPGRGHTVHRVMSSGRLPPACLSTFVLSRGRLGVWWESGRAGIDGGGIMLLYGGPDETRTGSCLSTAL